MRKFLFKRFVELTGNQFMSSILRTFSKSRLSKPVIRPFIKTFNINTQEMENPVSNYKSLHELFTRKLAPGIRPIDQDPYALISPVDGIVNDMGHISKEQTFTIKGQEYHLQKVLGNPSIASTYEDGYFYIIYLSPKHYHRIHYPIQGDLKNRYALGERSYPVNDLGMRYGEQLFASNYRIISEIATEFGRMAIVKVGALNINSIGLTNPAKTFHKGDEIGYFSFGSTVILFLEKHHSFQSIVSLKQEVQMGERIGQWEAHS